MSYFDDICSLVVSSACVMKVGGALIDFDNLFFDWWNDLYLVYTSGRS